MLVASLLGHGGPAPRGRAGILQIIRAAALRTHRLVGAPARSVSYRCPSAFGSRAPAPPFVAAARATQGGLGVRATATAAASRLTTKGIRPAQQADKKL